MNILRSCLLRLLPVFILGWATFAQNAGDSKPKPTISVTISPIADTVKAGSAVKIKVVLENISDHNLSIVRDVQERDAYLKVFDDKGQLAPDTELGYVWNGNIDSAHLDPSRVSSRALLGSLLFLKLSPQKSLTSEVDAAQFYDMTQPGKYTIEVRKPDPDNASERVISNKITVTITS